MGMQHCYSSPSNGRSLRGGFRGWVSVNCCPIYHPRQGHLTLCYLPYAESPRSALGLIHIGISLVKMLVIYIIGLDVSRYTHLPKATDLNLFQNTNQLLCSVFLMTEAIFVYDSYKLDGLSCRILMSACPVTDRFRD